MQGERHIDCLKCKGDISHVTECLVAQDIPYYFVWVKASWCDTANGPPFAIRLHELNNYGGTLELFRDFPWFLVLVATVGHEFFPTCVETEHFITAFWALDGKNEHKTMLTFASNVLSVSLEAVPQVIEDDWGIQNKDENPTVLAQGTRVGQQPTTFLWIPWMVHGVFLGGRFSFLSFCFFSTHLRPPTLPKFNMESKNDGFQKESPIPGCHFQVPW